MMKESIRGVITGILSALELLIFLASAVLGVIAVILIVAVVCLGGVIMMAVGLAVVVVIVVLCLPFVIPALVIAVLEWVENGIKSDKNEEKRKV